MRAFPAVSDIDARKRTEKGLFNAASLKPYHASWNPTTTFKIKHASYLVDLCFRYKFSKRVSAFSSNTGPQEKAVLLFSLSAFLAVLALVTIAVYNVYFHPLSKFPGSKIVVASNLAYWYAVMRGEILTWTKHQHEKYGEVVRIGSDKVSYISPQAWKDIFGHRRHGTLENSKDSKFFIAGPYHKEFNILTTPDSEEHGRLRRIFSNGFSDKALREQEPMIQTHVDKLINVLDRAARNSNDAQDIVKLLNCTTFDIIADLVFGEPLGLLDASELSPWVEATFANVKTLTLFGPTVEYPILNRIVRLLTPKSLVEQQNLHLKFTSDRVDKKLQSGVYRSDIWDLALQKSDGLLSRVEQYSNANIMMVGGSETTATLLSGLTYLFLKHPEKLKRAVEEVRALPKSQLTFDGLVRLPYLQACLDETLRWYPPVPAALPREAPKGGNVILGEWVPEGTSLLIPHWVAYHSPVNFKHPDAFVPERWLQDENYRSDRKDVLQPFTFGPRACLGKNLAYHEMRLIMGNILWNFDLELDPESKNWSDQKIFTFWQKDPLWVKVKPVH